MKLCRYDGEKPGQLGFLFNELIVPVEWALRAVGQAEATASGNGDPLALMPHGVLAGAAQRAWERVKQAPDAQRELGVRKDQVTLRAPIRRPGKILLLAGNYAEHLAEEGLMAAERGETFPYVFMKPPTALNDPDAPVHLPRVSPDYIDYEGELGVVIGRPARHVPESEALEYVAGYTVVNDVSDRRFKPFPDRKPRERDAFFDWLHGKWHDGFCPIGPCLVSARAIPDPQTLHLTTAVNGELRQDASTAQMIFPVAAVIEFLSRWMTLEPGDLLVTGTPSGVGTASGRFLRPNDVVEVTIDQIGTLSSKFVPEP